MTRQARTDRVRHRVTAARSQHAGLSVAQPAVLAAQQPARTMAGQDYDSIGRRPLVNAMLQVAGEMYQSALDEDPGFAPAWAKLGLVHRVLAK
jgi:hypothetical protein